MSRGSVASTGSVRTGTFTLSTSSRRSRRTASQSSKAVSSHCLLEELDQMNEALEGRVFDVIGEVLSLNDVNLPDMLRDAAYDPRRLEEYLDQIDRIDPAKLKEYEEATGIALARSHVDFSAFQRRNLEVEERRLMPRYVEAQFIAAAKEVGLRVEPRADGLWRVEHVLADLRSERLRSVQKVGKAEVAYRKITFHKHHLEQSGSRRTNGTRHSSWPRLTGCTLSGVPWAMRRSLCASITPWPSSTMSSERL